MISVCMTTYNGSEYLNRQISSILKQLSINDELIISDDGSTDGTIELLNSYNDSRILILNHKNKVRKEEKVYSHYLVSSNFENALKHAKGDFIFLTDQDDIWLDNKIEVMLSYLGDFSLVMSDCAIINQNDIIVNDFFFKPLILPRGLFLNISKPIYHGCCMAFTRSVLQNALPFPEKLILHDSWLGILAESFGRVKFIEEKLVLYRRHQSNASFLDGKSKNTLLFKIKYRIVFFCEVIKRIFIIKFFRK